MYFIAEIGVNHEASLKKAFKIIMDAKKAGAHAVKFQCYKAEKLASKYANAYWDKKVEKENSQLKLYKKFDKFLKSDYKKIFNFCKKIKIDFIITPFDLESVNFFKNKVKYFKISSSDITNLPLIEKVAETKKPVILSTGASNKFEIKRALKILKKKTNKIILLHCILNYPTHRYDANLNMILDLKKITNNVGLSDHTLSENSHEILIYSYLLGVRYIEKHFTDNKKKPGNDHFHSFDKKDLRLFFEKLSHVQKILGSNIKYSLKSEEISRQNARRSIFYNKDLKLNSKIKTNDLIMLRPAIGVDPFKYKGFIGKILKSNKKKGDLLDINDFK